MNQLTKTETIVAHNIAQGFVGKEIADRLCMSAHTVHAHSRNIRQKWNARNIADVTRMYILSLDNPKLILKAMVCLMIHIGTILCSMDADLRRPVVNRFSRTARAVSARANTPLFYV